MLRLCGHTGAAETSLRHLPHARSVGARSVSQRNIDDVSVKMRVEGEKKGSLGPDNKTTSGSANNCVHVLNATEKNR